MELCLLNYLCHAIKPPRHRAPSIHSVPVRRRLYHAVGRDLVLRRDAVRHGLGRVVVGAPELLAAGAGRVLADVVARRVLALLEDALPREVRVADLLRVSGALDVVVVPTPASRQLVLGPADALVLLARGLPVMGGRPSLETSATCPWGEWVVRVDSLLTGRGRPGRRPRGAGCGCCSPCSWLGRRRT